jgi:hypothetical protein
MKKLFRDNGLSIALLAIFFAVWMGQTATGLREYNNEQQAHQEDSVGIGAYLGSGHWREATFENWESEFLQMGAYVLLTAYLVQRGSAESKKPTDEGANPGDADPSTAEVNLGTPWPVRVKGVWLALYSHSLSTFFFILFFASMLLHANGGVSEYNSDQQAHGEPGGYTMWRFMTTSRFWFQSLQNWQSEFLAVGAIVLASIWLRQKGSPESKPVQAPHAQTGPG